MKILQMRNICILKADFRLKITVALKLVQHINQYTFFFYKVIKKTIIMYIFKIFYLLRIILFILKVLVQF